MNEYTYDEIEMGSEFSFDRTITAETMKNFLAITGDENPLHNDDNYARSTKFGQKVVYGLLVTSLLSTLAGMHIPGKHSLILKVETNMKRPAFIGDTLKVSGKVSKKIDFSKTIVIDTKIVNQKGETLQDGSMHIKVLK